MIQLNLPLLFISVPAIAVFGQTIQTIHIPNQAKPGNKY